MQGIKVVVPMEHLEASDHHQKQLMEAIHHECPSQASKITKNEQDSDDNDDDDDDMEEDDGNAIDQENSQGEDNEEGNVQESSREGGGVAGKMKRKPLRGKKKRVQARKDRHQKIKANLQQQQQQQYQHKVPLSAMIPKSRKERALAEARWRDQLKKVQRKRDRAAKSLETCAKLSQKLKTKRYLSSKESEFLNAKANFEDDFKEASTYLNKLRGLRAPDIYATFLNPLQAAE